MLYIFQGFSLAIGLIVAIGVQNAFVLERSLRRERIYTVVLLCILCDIIFFTIGAYGVSYMETILPGVQRSVAFVSGFFLLGYAVRSALYVRRDRSVSLDVISKDNIKNNSKDNVAAKNGSSSAKRTTLYRTILFTLAVALLNPHFYLDTVFLFGTRASLIQGAGRNLFLLGGCIASIVWFMSLALLGKHLGKYFTKVITWKFLDAFIAVIMAYWAYVLLFPFFE